jgi:hypothetical protein
MGFPGSAGRRSADHPQLGGITKIATEHLPAGGCSFSTQPTGKCGNPPANCKNSVDELL